MILTAVTLVQIPLIVLYFFLLDSFTERMIGEQWSYQKDTMDTYAANLRDEIQKIDQFLYTKELSETYDDLIVSANEFVNENSAITELVFFDEEGRELNRVDKVFTGYQARYDSFGDRGWYLDEQDGQYYMVRNTTADDTVITAVISIRRLAATSSNIYNIPGSIVFKRGEDFLSSALWQRSVSDPIPAKITEPEIVHSLGRQYMLSETNLLGMRMLYSVIYYYDFRWLYYFGYLFVGVAVLSLAVTMFYLRRTILKPMSEMETVMDEIGSGDMEKRLPEGTSKELAAISDTFNTMMDHLRDAKIESYEQRLTARRAKTDALRLQIRRHFFLNCLKNIYAMASTGNMDGVKQTALLLSTNLRYTLNFDNDSVPLKEELKMCEDYIKLQGIGQPLKPMLVVESIPELDDFEIPPVSLLTILENSCKYGSQLNLPLVIRIQTEIRSLDEQKYAIITVRDNGRGYDKDMLKLLNQDIDQVKEQNHIGMANTLLRFRMLYGDDCSVLFSNNNGAKVDLMIPMKMNSEATDETVNCG